MATLTENLVLSKEHTVDTTHEATTFTVQVGVDLLLKGGIVKEEGADGTAGTLRGDEDNIDIGGDVDLGQVLENGGETVGEVKGLSLGEERLNLGPGLGLGSIGEEVHDDGTLVDGGLDIE